MSKTKKPRSFKKKDLEKMLVALFEQNPTTEYELKNIYRTLKLTTHPSKVLCLDLLFLSYG